MKLVSFFICYILIIMFISKSSKKYLWTKHAEFKLRFYRLSAARIMRVIHSPLRIEEGIAPNTVAMMQGIYNRKQPYEIWTMVQGGKKGAEMRIISAWRYPGKTKPGEPLPNEILREIKEGI